MGHSTSEKRRQNNSECTKGGHFGQAAGREFLRNSEKSLAEEKEADTKRG
jgi:hypothetical protein